jgi:hypothetical protein
MASNPPTCSVCALCLLVIAAACRADDLKAPALDPAMPQPLDMSFSRELVENSPFTRAVNLAASLQLTGVAFIDGKEVVTVKDRDTKQSHVITEEPNAQGWKLVTATPNSDFRRAEAQIIVGTEVVNLRYADVDYTVAKVGGSSNGGYMPSKIPTREEYTGHDSKGDYVRGMPYLSDADRAKMREVPRESRDKFLEIVHDQRDKLFKASHEERAAFVKQAFDKTMRR